VKKVDMRSFNIWALFVLPAWEKRGIGKQLLREAVQWLWSEGARVIWLTTDPHTRAEEFYRRQGWTQCGVELNGEIRYELKRRLHLP
jgi:GNAT superfamily N-acetyltransferase